MGENKKVLLHICCGVCLGSVVQKLRADNYEVEGFFYNPNIYPEEEYSKRSETVKEASRILNLELITGGYDKDKWIERIKGFETEPEGGQRCLICFKLRLEETARKAAQLNIPHFSTTLTVSPHKETVIINKIGRVISDSGFLPYDYKKEDGFSHSMEFTKKHNLYRQKYCGCIYSFR